MANKVTSTPALDEALGEQRRELLPRPVVPGRRPPRDRRQHGDSDRAAGLAVDGNVDVLRLPGPNFACSE